MAYKHVIRAKTKNLMTDEMFISAGFTKQPDGSWYVSDSVVLNNKVMWENTEGIAGPITMSFYGRSSAPYYAGVAQWLVEEVDGTISYRTPTGTSSEWVYGTWTFDSKTVSKVYWVNISNRPLYLRDVMFEWGSTPTPYTPYNYLQSNKRMIKVSDVCQLYDKTYPVTQTVNGVTFTNNGDGSVTVNGTAPTTKPAFIPALPRIKVNPGDKILMFSGYDIGGLKSAFVYTSQLDANGEWRADLGYPSLNGRISTCRNNIHYIDGVFRVDRGNTATNAVIKLQIFNLTEMFGAGHEPATVAEFRQRFPNELYPYSPQCWLTSYKSAVVCKTKNLCDFARILTLPLDKQFESTGFSQVEINVEPNTQYTLSRENNNVVNLGDATYLGMDNVSRGNHPAGFWLNHELLPSYCKQQITIESNADGKLWIFFSSPIYNAYKNGQNPFGYLQLEKGSTATSYVPYQHL